MNILVALFLSSLLQAQTAPLCPPESFLIEFTSPTTGGKKSFCGYQKDGETVKHGEEWSYDRSGILKKKINFQHGIEGEAESQVDKKIATATDHNVPGTEEAGIISAIGEMLKVLTLRKSTSGNSLFKVDKCDSRPADWLKGALMNSPISKSYTFNNSCDVKGSFTATFGQIFPINFELRKLQDFHKAEMKIKMTFKKSAMGIRYRFEADEGLIISPSTNANFKVEYEVDINPFSGEPIKSSQQGKVSLIKLNGKDAKAEASLFYDN
jgi:hypothetical protein